MAYTSLELAILEYGAACWEPYRECQISALDRVLTKAAKFVHHSGGSEWEYMAQRRKIARICALYRAYRVFFCSISCVLLLVLSCVLCSCCWLAVCIVASCIVCIVVVVLYKCCYLMCICCTLFFTLDAGLLARSQYSESPATGHLDTGFSWFPCVYKQMLSWFPRIQVATTCFSCSPPDLNLVVTNFMFCIHVK